MFNEIVIKNVRLVPYAKNNLFSLSKILKEGWTIKEDKNTLNLISTEVLQLVFNILLKTT